MSSIWRRAAFRSKETESIIKGVGSWVFYRTVLKSVACWVLMVNYGSGRNNNMGGSELWEEVDMSYKLK